LSGETPDFSLGLGDDKIGISEIFCVPYNASSLSGWGITNCILGTSTGKLVARWVGFYQPKNA